MTLRCVELRSTIVERHKADQPRRQYSFRELRVDRRGKGLTFGMVLVAAVEAVMPGTIPPAGLLLVGIGLVMGFMNQIDDVATRTAYYVLAFTLPTIADSADVIPTAGPIANSFLDHLAMSIAGVAIASVFLQVYKMVREA